MIRRLIATGAAVALVPAGVLAGTATSSAQCKGGCDDGDITVKVSDSTPASGQQFIVRGKLTMGGLPADDHVVKVQSKLSGRWQQISGARMTTDADGRYRLRLILQTTGKRELRVLGIGEGDEPNEAQRFVVRVH
jgi:hypothetical protein